MIHLTDWKRGHSQPHLGFLLLVLAGDVELNPGPVFDSEAFGSAYIAAGVTVLLGIGCLVWIIVSQAREEKRVTIVCASKTRHLKLAKAMKPEYLQQVFMLGEAPKYLILDNAVVELDDLKHGETYQIEQSNECSQSEKIKKVGDDYRSSALYCSMAVYEDSPVDFLNRPEVLSSHQIDEVGCSKYGDQKVLLGISRQQKSLYLAYRGTAAITDWDTNIKVAMKKADHLPGKCHHGYAERAKMLSPANIFKFAQQHDLRTIIACGHSLGGAVSSITALKLLQATQYTGLEIYNITFGSPYVGNSELGRYCQKEGISHRFLHYVNSLDPVPNILSLGNTMADILRRADDSIPDAARPFYDMGKTFLKQFQPFFSVLLAVGSAEGSEKFATISSLYSQLTKPEEKPSLQWNINEKDKYVPNGCYVLMTDEKSTRMEADAPEMVKLMLGLEVQEMKGNAFSPQIMRAYFEEIHGQEQKVQLVIIGANLSSLILKGSKFNMHNLNLADKLDSQEPFNVCLESGLNDKVTITYQKKDGAKEGIIHPLGMGHNIQVQTAFGEETFIVREVKLINQESILVQSKNEPVALVLRKSIQRAIALKSCMKERETLDMMTDLLKEIGNEELTNTWNYLPKSQSLLIDTENFKCLCDMLRKTEDQLKKYTIQRGKLSLRKAKMWASGIVSTTIGGLSYVAAARTAALEAANPYLGAVVLAAAAISSAGLLINKYFRSYEEVIALENDYKILLQHALTSLTGSDDHSAQSTFEMEKRVVKFYKPSMQDQNASRWSLFSRAQTTENRDLKAVNIVHKLRMKLVDFCFVGIVGVQNCGKSTLINRIWDVGAKSGHTEKTSEVNLYPITEKFIVADYPGSQGINDHTAAFAQCGIMNNLIIVVLRYDGQVDKRLFEEVQTTLAIVKGCNGSARVVFCVNKAEQELAKLSGELKEKNLKKPPFEYMKNVHVQQLRAKLWEMGEGNMRQSNRDVGTTFDLLMKHINFEDNYFFTSFTMDDPGEEEGGGGLADRARSAGIIGIGEIKEKIRSYLRLKDLGTEEEIEACLRPKAKAAH